MQLYLPIAEVSVNAFLLLGLGGIVGFLSGMFGVGGGFLITPLLFFIGIPPAVAVATGANQVVASSVSGVLAQLRRKAVDFQMGLVLLAGGIVGSALGIWVFTGLTAAGPGRPVRPAVLRALPRPDRRDDAAGKPARAAPPARGRAPRRAGAHVHLLGAPPAAEDEVPRLGPLHQRHPARCWWARRWASCRDHGGGRRVHHGARDDLPSGHAHQGRGRHLAVPDHLRHRLHHRHARDRPARRSTWCWRCC